MSSEVVNSDTSLNKKIAQLHPHFLIRLGYYIGKMKKNYWHFHSILSNFTIENISRWLFFAKFGWIRSAGASKSSLMNIPCEDGRCNRNAQFAYFVANLWFGYDFNLDTLHHMVDDVRINFKLDKTHLIEWWRIPPSSSMYRYSFHNWGMHSSW